MNKIAAPAEVPAPELSGDDSPCGWDPDLVESIYDLLNADTTSPALIEGLAALKPKYGNLVYSELIYLLSHLRFEPDEAMHHWEQILEHRRRLHGAQGAPADVRVALVSYFVEVHRKLRNPKIIEMKLFERTRACAYRDELTGLHNFRLFREYLDQEILRSERYGRPLSLVLADIDSFKNYNDLNGHEAGNDVLVGVAALLRQTLRKADVAARYGGEEFALILPATPKINAGVVAERARAKIESQHFVHQERQPGGRLTASLGVATFPADASDAGELVRHADRAMYLAKANGKNQIQLYGKSRRSFGRVEAALTGDFRVVARGTYPLTTVNISEAGLLILTPQEIGAGSLVDFELRLPQGDRQLRAAGRVVHVDPVEGGLYRAAVSIAEMGDGDRAVLAEYVRSLGRKVEQ